MDTIQWRIEINSPPIVIKHCKKCGTKTHYFSSGMFRVNAQQKSLDVWLIYNCGKCKTSWNSTIFSRVNPKAIGTKMLHQFTDNDPTLALRYAMDTEILKRNGVEATSPEYHVIGDPVDTHSDTKIIITCPFPTTIRLSKILREKLAISNKDFRALVDSGTLILYDSPDPCRAKLQGDCVVSISGKPQFNSRGITNPMMIQASNASLQIR